jgi:hypothetical protein
LIEDCRLRSCRLEGSATCLEIRDLRLLAFWPSSKVDKELFRLSLLGDIVRRRHIRVDDSKWGRRYRVSLEWLKGAG